jgi:hypothetical protein
VKRILLVAPLVGALLVQGAAVGGASSSRTLTVRLSEWRVQPKPQATVVAGLHRAVVPVFVGNDQTVTAKFASTSQSTGVPTFGLLLRYQDPANYYMLYRQAGGTSVLRIAKVVNGVTTVLASTGIMNPTVNTLFPLTAKATGSTLTVSVGTTSVSTSDATFASGSAGVILGSTGTAVSHRADDFSATSP